LNSCGKCFGITTSFLWTTAHIRDVNQTWGRPQPRADAARTPSRSTATRGRWAIVPGAGRRRQFAASNAQVTSPVRRWSEVALPVTRREYAQHTTALET
jgi:hypothetical protein